MEPIGHLNSPLPADLIPALWSTAKGSTPKSTHVQKIT